MFPYYYNKNDNIGYLRYLVSTNRSSEIKITSTANEADDHPPSLIITNPITDRWASKSSTNFGQYVQIELLSSPLFLTHYSYFSVPWEGVYNMNWNFSVSKDGINWIVVDSHVDDDVLKSNKEEKFKINKPDYYRYFRLTNTGKNYYETVSDGDQTRTILYVAQIDLYTNKLMYITQCESIYNFKYFHLLFIFIILF